MKASQELVEKLIRDCDLEFYISKTFPESRINNNALYLAFMENFLGIEFTDEQKRLIVHSKAIESLTRARRARLNPKGKKLFEIFTDEWARMEQKEKQDIEHKRAWMEMPDKTRIYTENHENQ